VRHLYDWFGPNVALFHLVNGVHSPWWDRFMLTMTWLGNSELYPYYLALLLLVAQAAPRWLPRRHGVPAGARPIAAQLRRNREGHPSQTDCG
jgi:hypothetical protein